MSPNLVGAAGPEPNLEKRETGVVFDRPPVCQGGATGFESRRHAGAVARIAGDRAADASRAAESAFDEREIDFFDRARLKLRGHVAMSHIRPGDEQSAAGEAVETMHDS